MACGSVARLQLKAHLGVPCLLPSARSQASTGGTDLRTSVPLGSTAVTHVCSLMVLAQAFFHVLFPKFYANHLHISVSVTEVDILCRMRISGKNKGADF